MPQPSKIDVDSVNAKEDLANKCFSSYVFSDSISTVDSQGWDRGDPLDFVKVAHVRFDDSCHRLSFHVRFDAQGYVEDVYALDNKSGNEFGYMPSTELEALNVGERKRRERESKAPPAAPPSLPLHQGASAAGSPKPAMREIRIAVEYDNSNEPEEEIVSGIYATLVPPDVSDGVAAWLALEAFHEKIGIDELDDYIISAYDPKTNIVLEQADDDEIPSGMSAQYCGLLSEDLDDLLLIDPVTTKDGEIKWQDLAYDLAASLDACTTQIEQMQGMFDDADGTITEATRAAARSKKRLMAAHAASCQGPGPLPPPGRRQLGARRALDRRLQGPLPWQATGIHGGRLCASQVRV